MECPAIKDPTLRTARELSEKVGGLNGSMQHLLGVYWPEFQNPRFFLDVD
jgi:hypothetical protein